MAKLSIFVDESGDFGDYEHHSPYYIVAMVLHNQNNNIADLVNNLNTELKNLGYKDNYVVHTSPLIRREEEHEFEPPNFRRSVFSKLFFFTNKAPIQYKTFVFQKKEFENPFKLQARMAREMSLFLRENLDYFQGFDDIILYYDNGQDQLNKMLNTLLATELSTYDVRRVFPKDYKLFQAADMICTLKLLEIKCETGHLTKSEELVFHSIRELKKNFIKPIKKKEFSR